MALVGIALSAGCGSPYYTADPIEARVVDADTGHAIEGAIVTANWQLLAGSLEGPGRKLRQLEVMETTTDSNGRFRFPGFTRINVSLDRLGEEDPQILIFKPGYEYLRTSNRYDAIDAPGPHRASSTNGMTLRMQKASADVKERAWNLGFLGRNLDVMEHAGMLNRIPRMLKATHCEKAFLKLVDRTVLISIPGKDEQEAECAQTKTDR